MTHTVADRLASLRKEIDDASVANGRARGAVRLLGVSKKQPAHAVAAAVAAGLDAVGENYVQEAKAKFASLPPVEKHFIGHVQTNKAKTIVELFDVVQSVDRADAARALGRAADSFGRTLSVLLQVNISQSERYGCPPDEIEALCEAIRAQPALRLDGVMAIGPLDATPGETAQAFALAAKTFALVGGSTLSIGMSGDWREAVRAGSTMVRIGTALFGARQAEGRTV